MIESIYRWLPRIFGCHCRSDRSFFYKGRQFPICARCTGELAGILVSIILFWFWKPTILISLLMMIPAMVDGLVQRFTSYESTNLRRVITGFFLGIALAALIAHFTIFAYMNGYHFGQTLRSR
ncbi:MAG: DUF2085 domain-containing protein [Butyrivibrio sp.]|nr:DUF2085 domain-containing protein [Butyrivibrio sp.]